MATDKIIDMTVDILVMALVLPVGLYALFTANQTGWSAEAIAIWAVVAILVVVSVLQIIRHQYMKGGKR